MRGLLHPRLLGEVEGAHRLGEVTGDWMFPARPRDELGVLLGADLLGLPAARAKAAARRRIYRARDITLEDDAGTLAALVRRLDRNRREESLRVGVHRGLVDLQTRSDLD